MRLIKKLERKFELLSSRYLVIKKREYESNHYVVISNPLAGEREADLITIVNRTGKALPIQVMQFVERTFLVENPETLFLWLDPKSEEGSFADFKVCKGLNYHGYTGLMVSWPL